MENNLVKNFENQKLGKVRVAISNGQPYFCLADVCKILGIRNPSDVAKKIPDFERARFNLGHLRDVHFISESGLYKAIMQSRKSEAIEFQQWVTGEVLPSIRQTGQYNTGWDIPKTYGEALRLAGEKQIEVEQLTIENKDLQQSNVYWKDLSEDLGLELSRAQPKVEFYDHVTGSDDLLTLGEVAKILHFDSIGRNNLFSILRDNNILMDNNQPYQRYVNRGYFTSIESKYSIFDDTHIHVQTMVTQKGLEFIRDLLLELGYNY